MSVESYLEEFVHIVEMGSVSGAARKLGLPRASVSRRLGRLEASYGVQLLHREPHQQELTQAGKELYQRARKIVAEIEETRKALSALDGVPRGLLRVSMPPASGIEMMLAQTYLARYPEVSLEFVATHEHSNLLSDNIDVALRAGPIQDDHLIGRKLVNVRYLIYGSPEFLAREGTPTIDTLIDYPCILGFDPAGRPIHEWPLWEGGSTPVRGPIRSNDMTSRIKGAKLGLGLTLASERWVRSWVATGELVPILEEVVGVIMPVTLVWPATEFMPPKVRAFIDLAAEVIGGITRQNP